MNARHVLVIGLLALAALFIAWFAPHGSPVAELLVFAFPPLALAMGVLRRMRTAPFWAGVLGLAWFSHGVMVAWSRPAEAGYAWAEIVLALVVIFSASWGGLHARFARRRG